MLQYLTIIENGHLKPVCTERLAHILVSEGSSEKTQLSLMIVATEIIHCYSKHSMMLFNITATMQEGSLPL